MIRIADRYRRLLRFMLIGGSCAALGAALIQAGTQLLNLHYLVATAIAFVIVGYVGHGLNRKFTFQSAAPYRRSLLRYYLVSAASLSLNLLAMLILVDGFGIAPVVASVLLSAAFMLINFFSHAQWSFPGSPALSIERDKR